MISVALSRKRSTGLTVRRPIQRPGETMPVMSSPQLVLVQSRDREHPSLTIFREFPGALQSINHFSDDGCVCRQTMDCRSGVCV